MRTETTDFSEIRDEFIQRAHAAVWCSVATINRAGRPRSRVLHPIWEGQTGWIATMRHSLKAKHLAHNPYVSLAYLKDPLNPVYADCKADWADNMDDKRRIWELFRSTPEPLGWDPANAFGTLDNPEYGLLKLIPWRVELYTLNGDTRIWRSE